MICHCKDTLCILEASDKLVKFPVYSMLYEQTAMYKIFTYSNHANMKTVKWKRQKNMSGTGETMTKRKIE